jgi:hypothetical protein
MLHLRRGLRDSRLRGCPLSLPSARENHPPKGITKTEGTERAGCETVAIEKGVLGAWLLGAWCLLSSSKGGVRKILIMTVLDYWVSPVEWVPVQYSVSTE